MKLRARGPRAVRLLLAAAVAALCLGPATAWAQEGSAPRAGAGFFAVGSSFTEIAELNRRLEAQGYPTFGRAMLTLGGGGYSEQAGGILIGGEGYGMLAGEEAFQGRTVSLGGGYGLFTVGYLAELAPRLRAYPMVGIGAGGVSLNIASRPTDDSFDEVLEAPDRSVSLGRGGFLVSVGAGMEYRSVPVGRAFVVGVRAGYLFEPASASWRLDGSPLADAPDSSLAGPYVRVMLGGGGG